LKYLKSMALTGEPIHGEAIEIICIFHIAEHDMTVI